ncbi:HAD family hydrolase [Nocardiopsis gilva YIM 90087]|uniref:HAD family hydrolase n=1 Tax=Nocardiopsis gilva YIM 90087 TaxID=1235441 RepID=A0A223S775_9ACTN|nr:HAD-IA family hydrolase [Nocardiopsis gilva]ASU83965.1 HAD family hydrolase [Nocardiopsis gilva YIM 90087]
MTGSGFDAVLCDIDGVLRLWDPDHMGALDRQHGLTEGTLAGAAFAPHRITPAITGQTTDAQWRTGVADDLAEACGSRSRAEAMVRQWAAVMPQVDPEVLRTLAAVRERARVVLVSNATTRLEEELDQLGLSDMADAVVNSSRLGVAKPDPAVYRAAADAAGASVQRCLFVDDAAANVAAARRLGMAGLHYTGFPGLRDVLAPLLRG